MSDYYSSLMFHEIVERPITKYSVSPAIFEKQMLSIVNQGICSFSFDTDVLKPDKRIYCLITFDDGHASNLYAARLLSELGLQGCFYLIKDYSIEKDDYLSEKSIKEIASLGHRLGVHGKSHRQWAMMEENELINDLREAKDWIEQLTGTSVISCSAPGGVIDERTISIIKSSIPELKYIRTSHYGINYKEDTVLKSIGIKSDYSVNKVMRLANNDFLEMKKMAVLYHAKEFFKPLYHLLKQY